MRPLYEGGMRAEDCEDTEFPILRGDAFLVIQRQFPPLVRIAARSLICSPAINRAPLRTQRMSVALFQNTLDKGRYNRARG